MTGTARICTPVEPTIEQVTPSPPPQNAGAERGHHHVDIAEADRRARPEAGLGGRLGGQRIGDHRPVHDLGQKRAAARQTERLDDGVVIAAICGNCRT